MNRAKLGDTYEVNMYQVIDIERDINRAKLGDTDEVNMYQGHLIKL